MTESQVLARCASGPTVRRGPAVARLKLTAALADISHRRIATHIAPSRFGLCAVLLLLAAALEAVADDTGGSVTVADNQPYTKGPYFAFAAPFNAGVSRPEADFDDRIVLRNDAFPNATAMSWRWPDQPCPKGIYNLMAVQFGSYFNTHSAAPIQPSPVDKVGKLIQTYDITAAGSLDDFDVITDFFRTSVGGRENPHAYEVEIFPHTPPYSRRYVESATPVGTFTDATNNTWISSIVSSDHIILFMPKSSAEMLSGALDIRPMLKWLVPAARLPGANTSTASGPALRSERTQVPCRSARSLLRICHESPMFRATAAETRDRYSPEATTHGRPPQPSRVRTN